MDERSNHASLRVAAIVLNSVSHDTRVLKEAASLREAGYEVTIFGVRDNRCADPQTLLPDGTRIVRVMWRSPTYRLIAQLFLAVGALCLAALGVAYWLWIESFTVWVRDIIVALDLAEAFKFGGLAVLLAGGAMMLLKPANHLIRMANRYAILDDPRLAELQSNEKASPSSVKRMASAALSRFVSAMNRFISAHVKRRQIVRAMEAYRPDVVHCHDLNALPIGCAYARRHKAHVVYDSHEIFEAVSMMSPSRRRWLEFAQRRYSGHVDLFITINESIATYLNRKYPKLPPAVVVKNAAKAPSGPVEYDGRLHRAAGLEPSTQILLYQGGFSRFRGLSILLQAAPLLPENWALVMMGWGALEAELKALAQRLDPAGTRIRFVPGAPLAELAQWTAGASLGVIPYENVCLNHWYCTPNKLWEYPLAGVPILASGFPELERTIVGNGIGRVLPDLLTPQAIADAVSSISADELQAMRERCRSFIEADNWSVYAKCLVASYDRLCRRSAQQRQQAEPSTTSAAISVSGPTT